jgi:hypothetical protein
LCSIPSVHTKEWTVKYGNDTLRFVYVGVGGPTEDEEYFSNPLLHKEMPRGYIEVYLNDILVCVIHGCNKFFGEEDDTTQGIDAKGKIPKVCVGDFTIADIKNPSTMVDMTVKANGKFMTISLFKADGKTWVVLSSKTTCVAFHLDGNAPSFQKHADAEENLILKGMYETFIRFWSELPPSARDALLQKSIDEHFTYLCEYEDGAHMVPLSGDNTLAITMVIRCSQTGKPSDSEMLHLVDGIHFADWLAKVGVPTNFIIQHMVVSIQEWFDKYSKEYSYTNFFDSGKLIEGYVVRFVSPDGKIMALMKSKTWAYVIKRAIREIFRGLIRSFKKDGKPINPADASTRLRKKITGRNAYPQGLTKPTVDGVCQLASDFVQFCLDVHTSKGVSLDSFVNFGGASDATDAGSPNGMAESWVLFLQHNGGHDLSECLALTVNSAADSKVEPAPAAANPEVVHKDVPDFVPDMGVVAAIFTFIQASVAGISVFHLGDAIITATSYGRQTASNIAPMVIFQAISGTGKSTLCDLLSGLSPGSVIACADNYFKEKCGGKYIAKLIGQAHAACRETAFATPLDKIVCVCNTSCNLDDSNKYVEHAIQTGRPIIFLNLVPNGAFEEFSPRLAARGEHVSDIAILEKQWNTMTKKSNTIPPTYDGLLKRFGKSQTTDAAKSSTDVKPPARFRGKPTPYTALQVVLLEAFRDMFPGIKPETHITLKFGDHVVALSENKTLRALELKLIEVREYIDPENTANFIACATVSSPVLDELQKAGLVQDHLHMTLRCGGTFKPVDSRKLLDGTLTPTCIIGVPEELATVVGTVAEM